MKIFRTLYGRIVFVLISIGAIFTAFVLLLLYYKNFQEKQISTTILKQFTNDAESLYTLKKDNFDDVIHDYTFWDEFAFAINKNDTAFLRANMGFESFNFSDIYVYDRNFKIIYEVGYSDSIEKTIIPEEAVHELFKKRFQHFFIQTAHGFAEVSAASVHKTDDPDHNKTEPFGYLFVIRNWDKDYLAELNTVSWSTISVKPLSYSFPVQDKNTIYTEIETEGWDGKPVAKIVFSRNINLNSPISQNILWAMCLFVGLTLIAINYFALIGIHKPLKRVTHILETDNNKSIQLLKKAGTEFGYIGELFEKYIRQKEELTEAKLNAEQSDRLKSAFLANMSHEIRTPMNGVIGFASLLREDDLDYETRNKFLDIIESSSNQLLNLINDIIDLSKIEAGELKLEYKTCNLQKLFEEAEITYNEIKRYKFKDNIKFATVIPAQYPNLILNTDPIRLQQVLYNLLNNALKFSDKGTIEFGYNVRDNKVEVYVKDEGIGIPPDKLNSIFERFERVEHQHRRFEGTGLGLSISKGLIELLGGAITAVSTPEKGSEFKIEIPYMPVENTIVNPKANALPDKFFFHGKTILIVEDEDNNLKYLATILGRISANLILAKNGEEAIEKFKLHPETDLILMDIRMPLKNGDEAAIEILKIKTDAKIIALTAYAMSGDKEKYLKMGFVDYISKPVKKDELFQKIAYWIQ